MFNYGMALMGKTVIKWGEGALQNVGLAKWALAQNNLGTCGLGDTLTFKEHT